MRPIRLAVNLIHHPDEPDGVETRDGATTTMTGDCPGDGLSKYQKFFGSKAQPFIQRSRPGISAAPRVVFCCVAVFGANREAVESHSPGQAQRCPGLAVGGRILNPERVLQPLVGLHEILANCRRSSKARRDYGQ